MVAAVMAAASIALGWYYPRLALSTVSNRIVAWLLASAGSVAIMIILLIGGILAASSGIISGAAPGAAAIMFVVSALGSVVQRALANRRIRQRDDYVLETPPPRLPASAGQLGSTTNWPVGLFRSWVVVSAVWATVIAAIHIAGMVSGNLRPEMAIAFFLFWAALPPLALGLLAMSVRWAIAERSVVLIRSWVLVSAVWATVIAAIHIAGMVSGNLRPEVAIALFLLWAALPPLALGLLAEGVRWAIAGFRRDNDQGPQARGRYRRGGVSEST